MITEHDLDELGPGPCGSPAPDASWGELVGYWQTITHQVTAWSARQHRWFGPHQVQGDCRYAPFDIGRALLYHRGGRGAPPAEGRSPGNRTGWAESDDHAHPTQPLQVLVTDEIELERRQFREALTLALGLPAGTPDERLIVEVFTLRVVVDRCRCHLQP
ncbi:MAG: hypothetical protein ACRDRO_04230 [Pseudonocardiaceae bacterium]